MANVGSWQPDRLDTIHYIHKLAEARVGEGYSVISGCDVHEKGIPDMDVVVDSGEIFYGDVYKTVAGNNVTISAANGTNDRIDVIYVDSSGVAQVHTGDALPVNDPLGNTVWTQYESPYPKTGCPTGVIIALVYVPANDTSIENAQIEDIAQYNIRKHAIDSTVEHTGVSGATENNFVSFDANGLPKDSGHKDADYEDAGTASTVVSTHESSYTHSLIADHGSRHITSGDDEIDGDKLDIDWNPTNYTPSTSPSEVNNADNLTAHLYGIDQKLGTLGSSYRYILFLPQSFGYPATNPAELIEWVGTNTTRQEARFDDTTEEFVTGGFPVPADYDSSGTITIMVIGRSLTAAASKNVAFTFRHLPLADSEAMDVAYTSSASGDSATDATQGDLEVHSWTVGTPGWAKGDWVDFKLSRNPSATENLTGDWCLRAMVLKIPVTG